MSQKSKRDEIIELEKRREAIQQQLKNTEENLERVKAGQPTDRATIAVSSSGPGGMDVMVDPRFGRCPTYTMVKVEAGKVTHSSVIPNSAAQAFGGAGIQAAQLVAREGAQVVICGNIGPNAATALEQLGVKVISQVSGITVRDAVQRFVSGELKSTPGPTVPAHSGMGFGPGMGRGMGGRGRGSWQQR